MDTSTIQTICKLRAVVGYLGERDQHGWWQSSFFSPSSSAFLAPLFARTQVLAQVSSVTQAATLVHDERIGVGRVYHLFRLPEDIERRIHQALYEPELCQALYALTLSQGSGLEYLEEAYTSSTGDLVGPTYLGQVQLIHQEATWLKVASCYRLAFENGIQILPYFSDQS